jgi:hypothetical protein
MAKGYAISSVSAGSGGCGRTHATRGGGAATDGGARRRLRRKFIGDLENTWPTLVSSTKSTYTGLRRCRTQQGVSGGGSSGQGGSLSGEANDGELRKAGDSARCFGTGKRRGRWLLHFDVRLRWEEQWRGGRDGGDRGPAAARGWDAEEGLEVEDATDRWDPESSRSERGKGKDGPAVWVRPRENMGRLKENGPVQGKKEE